MPALFFHHRHRHLPARQASVLYRVWALKSRFPPLTSCVALSNSCHLSVLQCRHLQSRHSEAPSSQGSCHQLGRIHVRYFHICRALARAARLHEEDTREEAQCTPAGAALLPDAHPPSAQEREEQRGRGALLGRETSPGFCRWKSLFLAALGSAAPSSAGSDYDYSHGLQSMLRWRSPPQSRLCLQTSLPSRYLPGWSCLGWGAPSRDEPPPARRPAIAFLPLPGSLWAPPDLALLPGVVREAFNTLKRTPGRPPPTPRHPL